MSELNTPKDTDASFPLLATFALLPSTTRVEWTTPNFFYVKTPWTGALTGSLNRPKTASFSRARALPDGQIAVLCTKMGHALSDLSERKRQELRDIGIDSITVPVPLGSEGMFWAHDDACFNSLDSALAQGHADEQCQTEVCVAN